MGDKVDILAETGQAKLPQQKRSLSPSLNSVSPHKFEDSWQKISGNKDRNKFQRFTTLHLLNLRLLEEELSTLQDQVIRAGLKISGPGNEANGIIFTKTDDSLDILDENGKLSSDFVIKLRTLTQQYDEALLAFNDVRGMESTLLDGPLPHLVGLEQRYKGPWIEEMLFTRLVKPQSSNTEDNDIIRQLLRKIFVTIAIALRKKPQERNPNTEEPPAEQPQTAPENPTPRRNPETIRNSKAVRVPVEFFTRLILALVSGALLIAPLTILSFQSTRKAHLITVSVSTVLFSLLVSLISKSSNSEIMAAAAGYTAVLVVFFAVAPQSYK